jgi:hypothetical protein
MEGQTGKTEGQTARQTDTHRQADRQPGRQMRLRVPFFNFSKTSNDRILVENIWLIVQRH